MTEGIDLRERFFALHGSRDQRARAELLEAFAGFDPPATCSLRGLPLCHVPSLRFCQMRLLEAELLDASVRELFMRPRANMPSLAAVFIDPQELAYHNFEHIIGLDHLFPNIGNRHLRIGQLSELGKGVWTSTTTLAPELQAELLGLDALDIYLPPVNVAARGGKRCIFHCTPLATVLEAKLRSGLPKPLREGFLHVNPVFRLSRFEPGDERFLPHVDAPFSDPRHDIVSKYTLLLYLTGGRGEATLSFEQGTRLDEIAAGTVVIFEQALAHEGGPFASGPKLFLRTELLYTLPRRPPDTRVAALFAKACYLDGESVFAPALARFAHAAHDRAAAAHWQGPSDTAAIEPLVHKQFRDVQFVTNGHDYWFRAKQLPTIECAAIALFDALNVRVGATAFRRQCRARALLPERPNPSRERSAKWEREAMESWIAAQLLDAPVESPFGRIDKRALLPDPEQPDPNMSFPSSPDFGDPFPSDWDATRHPEVIAEYQRACKHVEGRLFGAPVLLLGQELFLDPERFVIEGDKIHVLSAVALRPVHFAGAIFYSPEDFIEVDLPFGDLQCVVPPIQFHEDERLLHLSFDLFRNGWMLSEPSFGRLVTPRIADGEDLDADVRPFGSASGLPRR